MKSTIENQLAKAGMRQSELARLIGVHKVTVNRWCKDGGILGMTLRQLERVADAIGCPVKDLFE